MSENVYLAAQTGADRGDGREQGMIKHSMPKVVPQQTIDDKRFST